MSSAAKKAWATRRGRRRKRGKWFDKCPKCGRKTSRDVDGTRVEYNCPVHGRVAIFDRGE